MHTSLRIAHCQVRELEQSFTRFRQRGKIGPDGEKKGEGEDDEEKDGDEQQEHVISVHDLVAALGVTQEIAEEMIYIADMQDNDRITFTEFRQIVVNWD